eukprot:4174666-Prymnesium_polylepis.1
MPPIPHLTAGRRGHTRPRPRPLPTPKQRSTTARSGYTPPLPPAAQDAARQSAPAGESPRTSARGGCVNRDRDELVVTYMHRPVCVACWRRLVDAGGYATRAASRPRPDESMRSEPAESRLAVSVDGCDAQSAQMRAAGPHLHGCARPASTIMSVPSKSVASSSIH